MKKSEVSNYSGGVQTDDGRTLYGLDAEIYLQMKAKEDPELERKVGEWIEDVLEMSLEDTSDLWKSLKSGIVLCQLVNKIKPGTIKKYNDKKQLHVLMERENINLYLESCWRLGVPKSDIFVTTDLHGRRAMSSVIQNLVALSRIAPRFLKDRNIQSLGPQVAIRPESFKWDLNYRHEPIYSEQLEADPESAIKEANQQLERANLTIQKLEASTAGLKADLAAAREKIRKSGSSQKTPEIISGEKTPEITCEEKNSRNHFRRKNSGNYFQRRSY